jgi:sulfite oxidase
VEISANEGATWTQARLLSEPRRFVWCLWDAELSLPRGEHELVCRATDDAGNTQPRDAAQVWNVKGYLNNSWDRIRVRVE